MQSTSDILRRMRLEQRVVAVLRQFNVQQDWKCDLEALSKEVRNLHTTRPIKTLALKHSGIAKSIIRANIVDQSNRSRLIEIALDCKRIHNNISIQLDLVRESLMLKYRKSLASYRSKEEKSRVLDTGLFRDIVLYLRQIENLLEEIEYVVEDIDKAGFTLQRLSTAISLSSQVSNKERSL